jgi:hypothetical protein
LDVLNKPFGADDLLGAIGRAMVEQQNVGDRSVRARQSTGSDAAL